MFLAHKETAIQPFAGQNPSSNPHCKKEAPSGALHNQETGRSREKAAGSEPMFKIGGSSSGPAAF